ncbi:MAG: SDR family oxidoreductase [Candidatus Omnitrophica bacterium]|nr:SDR family oxidoreductase [Candidatus Omnitrophota bacterium]
MKKTVVITGGNKGIGAQITRSFAQAGYRVVVAARTDTGLSRELGEDVRFIKCDVRKESDHQKVVQSAKKWTKRLDVYINCAGFSKWSPIGKVTNDFWNAMIDTNLKGTFLGCKVAAQSLNKGGAIINISSLAGRRGSANNSVYCASKFGVTGLTQALSKELGKDGIRVNAICPVYIETKGLLQALKSKVSPTAGKNIKSYLSSFAKSQSGLKRLPQAKEVADSCLFLASNSSSAITGQSINVDCGVMPL